MRTDPTPPHRRVSDYSACPKCVAKLRAEPYATDFINAYGILWGFCVRQHLRWAVTREFFVGPIPDISRRPAILFLGYTEVHRITRFSAANPNRDIAALIPAGSGAAR